MQSVITYSVAGIGWEDGHWMRAETQGKILATSMTSLGILFSEKAQVS
jgi:hypothetical protein